MAAVTWDLEIHRLYAGRMLRSPSLTKIKNQKQGGPGPGPGPGSDRDKNRKQTAGRQAGSVIPRPTTSSRSRGSMGVGRNPCPVKAPNVFVLIGVAHHIITPISGRNQGGWLGGAGAAEPPNSARPQQRVISVRRTPPKKLWATQLGPVALKVDTPRPHGTWSNNTVYQPVYYCNFHPPQQRSDPWDSAAQTQCH